MTTRTRRRTSLRVGAGISTRRSGLAATEDALGAALAPLDGAIPDLAFLFVAPQFEDELESIIESANASLGGGTLLGCVAGGVIGGAREVEDAPAVSAWAATLPGVRVRPFTLTYAEEEEHGVFDGLEEVPTRAPDSVLVMLADPYTFPAHLLLDHLNEHAPGLPVVGGMASGGIVAGRTRLIADDEILTEGAVGAILEGAEGATAVVSQGCRPVGETFAITRAERNVVFELGGQPAVTRLERTCARHWTPSVTHLWPGRSSSRATGEGWAFSVSPITTSTRCGVRSETFRWPVSSPRASLARSADAISCMGSPHPSCCSGILQSRSYNSFVRKSSGRARKWLSW